MEQCGIFSTTPKATWKPGTLPGTVAGDWAGRVWYLNPDASHAQVLDVARHVRRLTQPAPEDLLMKALTECALLTKLKNMEPDEAKATVKVYTRRLQEYPADLVLHRLRDWPTRHRFFPSLEEIVSDLHGTLRFRVIQDLTRAAEAKQPSE